MERLQELLARQAENPLSWKNVNIADVLSYRLVNPLGNYWPLGLVTTDEDGDRRIFTFSVRGMIKFRPDNSDYGNLTIAKGGFRYAASRAGVQRAALAQWGVAIGATGWSDAEWNSFRTFITSVDEIISAAQTGLPIRKHLDPTGVGRGAYYTFRHHLMVPKSFYTHLCHEFGIEDGSPEAADPRTDTEGFYQAEKRHVADRRLDPIVRVPLDEDEIAPSFSDYFPPLPDGYKYGSFKDLTEDDVADFVICVQTYTVGGEAVNTPRELGIFLALKSITLLGRAAEFADINIGNETKAPAVADANAPSPSKRMKL